MSKELNLRGKECSQRYCNELYEVPVLRRGNGADYIKLKGS